MSVDMDNGSTRSGKLGKQSEFAQIALSPNSRYLVRYFGVQTFETAITAFRTGNNGSNVRIPRAILSRSTSADSDDDGLSNDAEGIIGTEPLNPDTDGDGISDGTEVKQGTDPVSGLAVRTGVIATANTGGDAQDVAMPKARTSPVPMSPCRTRLNY